MAVREENENLSKLLQTIVNNQEELKKSWSMVKPTTSKHNHSLVEVLDCPECNAIIEAEQKKRAINNEKTPKPLEKNLVCDGCGEKLVIREDQKPEAVKVRLDIYRKDTAPVIEFYKNKGVVREVDSNPEISKFRDLIISSIQKALDE